MGHNHELLQQLAGPTKTLREAIPEVWGGFAQLHRSAMADGELPAAVKELIALAIAVTEQCDGCIAFHARQAARRGATSQQLAEMLGVVLMMGGGPASIYAPRAWEAFAEFSE